MFHSHILTSFFVLFNLKSFMMKKNVLSLVADLGLDRILDLIITKYPSLINFRDEVMLCV